MKNIKDLLSDWRQAKGNLEKLVTNLPRIMGNEAVRVVKENFRLQGYDDGISLARWAPRSTVTQKLYDRRVWVKRSVYNSGAPLLMQTMNLYDSIHYTAKASKVTIGVDDDIVPYGKWMNEGTEGTIGPNHYPTHTPGRPFMPRPGDPPNLKVLKAIEVKMDYERDIALSNFKK
jgi:hypothetical protein